MRLDYKNKQVFEECCVEWHPTLKTIVAECYYWGGYQLLLTSGYRKGNKGIHGVLPLRALDVRAWDPVIKNMVGWVNRNWIYDPERPKMKCAIFHNVGLGEHIHLQVCDNTRRIS